MVRMLLLMAALAGTAVFAGAQPPGKGDDKKDPQAKFEPKSKPGEGQKYLERYAGEFDVVKSFFPRTGEPVKMKGECKQKMIHEGRFLQSDFTFAGPTGPTTGTGIIGFEPESGKFTSTWIDSRQTRMSFRESEVKFDGKQIELVGKELGGENKSGRKSKTVTTIDETNKTIIHRQYSITADMPDRMIMELVLTRQPRAAEPGK